VVVVAVVVVAGVIDGLLPFFLFLSPFPSFLLPLLPISPTAV